MRIIDKPDCIANGGLTVRASAWARGEPFAGLACYGLWVSGVAGQIIKAEEDVQSFWTRAISKKRSKAIGRKLTGGEAEGLRKYLYEGGPRPELHPEPDTALLSYDEPPDALEVEEREAGVRAIIDLQGVLGIVETEEKARAGWLAMTLEDREQTMRAHETCFPAKYPATGGAP